MSWFGSNTFGSNWFASYWWRFTAPPIPPAPQQQFGGFVVPVPVDLVQQQRQLRTTSDEVLLIVCGLIVAASSAERA